VSSMPTTDLQYPIGTFQFGLPVTPQERTPFLSQIAEAPAKLRSAVAHLSENQLDTPYRPGGWTVRQVVHHLPDGHLNWYIRAKLALTETEPAVQAFSENAWAELPDARSSAIEPSLRIFEGVHARTVLFFESLAPQDWTRKLVHSDRGLLTIQDIVPALAWHSRHHTAHITELRRRMGWLAPE
jgi:uncharacterized damage-inducible protein DinB